MFQRCELPWWKPAVWLYDHRENGVCAAILSKKWQTLAASWINTRWTSVLYFLNSVWWLQKKNFDCNNSCPWRGRLFKLEALATWHKDRKIWKAMERESLSSRIIHSQSTPGTYCTYRSHLHDGCEIFVHQRWWRSRESHETAVLSWTVRAVDLCLR